MQTGCLALYLIQSPIFTSSTVGAFLLFHFCTFFFFYSDRAMSLWCPLLASSQPFKELVGKGRRGEGAEGRGQQKSFFMRTGWRWLHPACGVRSDDSSMWFIFLFQHFKLSRCEGVTVLWNLVAVSLEVARLSSAAARLQLWTLRWDFLPPH